MSDDPAFVLRNPVVTVVVYDPSIADPVTCNIVQTTQARLRSVVADPRPWLLVEQGQFHHDLRYRVEGDPPRLVPLAAGPPSLP